MHSLNPRTVIRQLVREKRNKLSFDQQNVAANLLKEQLIKHPKIENAQHIALYLSNDGELDTTPFILWCWQNNKKVYLPVLHPFSACNLIFLQYEPTTHMSSNMFGIKEPRLNVNKVCPILQLDILCTPLVAFDKTGARLGMGGGFYDRTLANWYENSQQNVKQRMYPIGIAHDCQLVDHVPNDYWDVPLPEIMTPTSKYCPTQ